MGVGSHAGRGAACANASPATLRESSRLAADGEQASPRRVGAHSRLSPTARALDERTRGWQSSWYEGSGKVPSGQWRCPCGSAQGMQWDRCRQRNAHHRDVDWVPYHFDRNRSWDHAPRRSARGRSLRLLEWLFPLFRSARSTFQAHGVCKPSNTAAWRRQLIWAGEFTPIAPF